MVGQAFLLRVIDLDHEKLLIHREFERIRGEIRVVLEMNLRRMSLSIIGDYKEILNGMNRVLIIGKFQNEFGKSLEKEFQVHELSE